MRYVRLIENPQQLWVLFTRTTVVYSTQARCGTICRMLAIMGFRAYVVLYKLDT